MEINLTRSGLLQRLINLTKYKDQNTHSHTHTHTPQPDVFLFFLTVLTGTGTPWPWTLISTNFPEQTQCHLLQMQILLSSSTEKFIKTPWLCPYLSSLMACHMHNAWESYKFIDFVMRTHLCHKTQRGCCKYSLAFISISKWIHSHGVTWSNMSNWSMYQWQLSRGGLTGRCRLPSPSFHSRHWFDVNLDHLSCVNCTCAAM